ncbi:hypothetical protein ONZ45_g7827 [Pleurotus djamor]|nr:hypothetical protein ONZ45_g7827 [Pleurotus djamor]
MEARGSSAMHLRLSALVALIVILIAPPSHGQETGLPATTDGHTSGWKLSQEGTTGVSAMQLVVVSERKALIFDKIEHNPLKVDGHPAWGAELDIHTRTVRPLHLISNTFCASGSFLGNGTFVHTGGNPIESDVGAYNINGIQLLRLFDPCDDESCDIVENPERLRMASDRWYPTTTRLEDGSILIFGGCMADVYMNNASTNNPTYEFFPPKNINGFNGLPIYSQFMVDSLNANLFPAMWSLPNGRIFAVSNQLTMLFDWKTNTESRLPSIPNGVRVSYPMSGGTVMLPLTIENNFTPEILICGGSNVSDTLPNNEYSSQAPASTQCARMILDEAGITAGWQVEHMPEPRTMVEMIILPNQKILMVNGMKTGIAAFNIVRDPVGPNSDADHPAFTPYLYDPKAPVGHRFTVEGLPTSDIPRMYHSTSTLLPDGSVLLAGSNPNFEYTTNVTYPTEYRMEFLSPPYMSSSRPVASGFPSRIDYNEIIAVKIDLPSPPTHLTVALIDLGFATHTVHMDQKFVELRSSLSVDGSYLKITGPATPRLYSPGPGFIYVVADGVPSIGKKILIGPVGTQPPVDQGASEYMLRSTTQTPNTTRHFF